MINGPGIKELLQRRLWRAEHIYRSKNFHEIVFSVVNFSPSLSDRKSSRSSESINTDRQPFFATPPQATVRDLLIGCVTSSVWFDPLGFTEIK